MANVNFTEAECQWLTDKINNNISPEGKRTYTRKQLINLFFNEFGNKHTYESIRMKINNLTDNKRGYNNFTKEELDYLRSLIKQNKFKTVDIALAFDDIYSEKHFDCGHTQFSIISKINLLKKEMGVD